MTLKYELIQVSKYNSILLETRNDTQQQTYLIVSNHLVPYLLQA